MNEWTVAYTDGASSGNPGPAGWAVFMDNEMVADCVLHATNNEMEMFAIYQAVANCEPGIGLLIISDSKLAIGLMTGWKTDKPRLSSIRDTAIEIARIKGVTLRFEQTKGHSSDHYNNLVDKAAVTQSRIASGIVQAGMQ